MEQGHKAIDGTKNPNGGAEQVQSKTGGSESKHRMRPAPSHINQSRSPASAGSGGTVDTSTRPKTKGIVEARGGGDSRIKNVE